MSKLFAALRPHQRTALLPYPYAVLPGFWTKAFEEQLRAMEPHCFNARRNDGAVSFVVRSWSGQRAIYVKDHGLAFHLMAMAPGDGTVWVRNPNLGEEC
jgi:hypothetical protein